MRILYYGCAPWASTAYGKNCYNICNRLKKYHHIDIYAYRGMKLGKISTGDMRIFSRFDESPQGRNWVEYWFGYAKADIILAHFDLWSIGDWLPRTKLPFVSYSPLDSEPMSLPLKDALRGAVCNVAMSKFAQRHFEKEKLTPTIHIPHGVDLEIYKPQDKRYCRKTLNLPKDAFIFGFVGTNISLRKNIPNQLKAFKIFLDRNPGAKRDTVFLLHTYIGHDAVNPAGYNLLEIIEGLGIEKNVKYTGPIAYTTGRSEEEMSVLYNTFDVLLNCTFGEGWGLPIMEAAACGVPTIGTNFSSMPELIESCGELVQPAEYLCSQQLCTWQAIPNTQEIAEKIELLYKDGTLRKKYSQKCIARAKEHNWDHLIKYKWKPLFDKIEKGEIL